MNAVDEAIERGRATYKARDFNAAAEAFQEAVDADPRNVPALFGLGNSLLEAKRDAAALEPLDRALALAPQSPDIRNSLGIALRRLKRYGAAIPHLAAAAEAYPENPGITTNLANACRSDHRLDTAEEAYKRALSIDATFIEACAGLGTTYRMAGRLAEAQEWLDRTLSLAPNHADARFSRALLYLEQGNFTFGFADYERRWASSDFPGRSIAGQEWQGEDLAGKTILVHAEQGLGDTIQFARFIPMLADRGARVLFYVQQELAPLMRSVRDISEIIPAGSVVPGYDFYVAVMSLPYHFGTTVDSIPSAAAYLTAPKTTNTALDAQLPERSKIFRIGLVWAGRASHTNDRQRSCRLADLSPLFDLPGTKFYSLQKEPRAEDSSELARITDLGRVLDDFGTTAQTMNRLDLIISVDTAPVHLAGALGRPAWLLLPHRAEWRWALKSKSSPWYPTVQIFRQDTPGDWTGLIDRVRTALVRKIGNTAGG